MRWRHETTTNKRMNLIDETRFGRTAQFITISREKKFRKFSIYLYANDVRQRGHMITHEGGGGGAKGNPHKIHTFPYLSASTFNPCAQL